MELDKTFLNNLRSQSSLYKLPQDSERRHSNTELANLFANLVVMNNIELMYEIGAQYAEISNFLVDKLQNTVAFEASSRNYESAKENIKSGVEYIHCAVGNYDGGSTLYFPIGDNVNPGEDSVKEKIFIDKEYKTESIKIIKLDSYCKENNQFGKSTALWIDVEGSTMEVLEGAESVLGQTKIIFIEVEQKEFWKNQSLVGEINKHLFDKGFVPVARDFEYEHQYNIVYVKNDILDLDAVDIPMSMFYTRYATKDM